MDDKGKGTNDLQVNIQIPNGVPKSVQVKYVEKNNLFFTLPFGGWLID